MKTIPEITKKLEKLRRNESQMTPEQKLKYAGELATFKKSIFSDCEALLKAYLKTAVRPCLGAADADNYRALCDRTGKVMGRFARKGRMEELEKILFRTYSVGEFLEAAIPWVEEVRYRAYAPYWCSHCRKVEMPGVTNWVNPSEGKKEFWWSDLYRMIWDEGSGIWLWINPPSWRWGLPPTMELCEAEYRKMKEKKG